MFGSVFPVANLVSISNLRCSYNFQVYELVGSQWMDQGTAFCFGQFSDENSDALLIARSERNYNDIILSTVIRSNDVYQRQQGG